MEEVLSNQQARPGDATQLMHVIFSSDDEMMSFYLTLNRFMNPESYLVERTDRKRLEDLASTLCSNVAAFEAIRNYKSISVKEVIRGFGGAHDEYANLQYQSFPKCRCRGNVNELHTEYH